MMKISKPNFKTITKRLEDMGKFNIIPILHQHGRMGVARLASATPVDEGETAGSWNYEIQGNRDRYKLVWTNSEMAGSVPLVIILQYGHATKSGYFIPGRNFINPAIRPVFESLRGKLGQEVLG